MQKGSCFLEVWEIRSGNKILSESVEATGLPVANFVNNDILLVHWMGQLSTISLSGKRVLSSVSVKLPEIGIDIVPLEHRNALYVSRDDTSMRYFIQSY